MAGIPSHVLNKDLRLFIRALLVLRCGVFHGTIGDQLVLWQPHAAEFLLGGDHVQKRVRVVALLLSSELAEELIFTLTNDVSSRCV